MLLLESLFLKNNFFKIVGCIKENYFLHIDFRSKTFPEGETFKQYLCKFLWILKCRQSYHLQISIMFILHFQSFFFDFFCFLFLSLPGLLVQTETLPANTNFDSSFQSLHLLYLIAFPRTSRIPYLKK